MERRQRSQPRVPVRREHRERLARLREHFVALEDHLVLRRVECDAARGERLRDGRVAIARLRLVVVIREYGVDAQLRGEAWNLVARARMPDDQPAAAAREARRQFGDAVMDELDAPVAGAGKRIEDLAIEYESAMHLRRRRQGVI